MTTRCIPLCYPDNFKWDRDEGELVRCGKTRGKLVVCEEALDILRSIDGPICPVTVTGPARTGKSYLASQLIEPRPFDCAFKTSNQMQPETMGIWMSTDVFKKTLGNGEEVTVVVLDTEGLGAYDANNQDDVHLFTLICLLSSVLVYNCRGTMTGEDLMKLSLVGALDKVIRGDEIGYSDKPKAKDFRKFFPNFLWVIRDVTLACTLRRGGKLVEVGMNEYMLKEVLNIENDDCENDKIKERNRLRKALLTSFPAFYSMKLSLPATDPSIMAVMNEGETRKRLSKPFLDGIEEFVSRCESLMKSKKAWPYVGNITGYNFAGLIRQYTYELAFDGTELCMQTIGKKVMEELLGKIEGTAFIEYCNEMGNFAESALPCPSHEVFNKHNECFFIALKTFKTNSKYINDVDLLNEYRHNLEERICAFGEDHHIIIGGYLNSILEDNIQKSDAFCKQLAMDLVKEKLDPLLKSSGGSRSPVNLNTEIQLVEKLYKEQARGPQVLHVYKTVLAEEITRITDAVSDGRKSIENVKRKRAGISKSQVMNMEKEELQEKEKFRQQILNMKQKVEEDIRKAMREDVTRQQKQSKADYEERSAAIAFQVKELLQIHSGLAKELMSINKELIKEHHISMEELNKKMEKITLVH